MNEKMRKLGSGHFFTRKGKNSRWLTQKGKRIREIGKWFLFEKITKKNHTSKPTGTKVPKQIQSSCAFWLRHHYLQHCSETGGYDCISASLRVQNSCYCRRTDEFSAAGLLQVISEFHFCEGAEAPGSLQDEIAETAVCYVELFTWSRHYATGTSR